MVTIGTINGGTRSNIVPETVEMTGTIRAYDEAIRTQVHDDIATVAGKIAESAGAKAEVSISRGYDTTVNDEELTARMLPVLERAADGRIRRSLPAGASEDFSVFAQQAPGLFVFLGITPEDQDPARRLPIIAPTFSSMRTRSWLALGPWLHWPSTISPHYPRNDDGWAQRKGNGSKH